MKVDLVKRKLKNDRIFAQLQTQITRDQPENAKYLIHTHPIPLMSVCVTFGSVGYSKES
jgi:hypothetical protein